jgi:hypothetical protein
MTPLEKYFGYNNGLETTKNAFRISASQISRYFDQTSQWYHEFLEGEEGFTGSTASALGNCVHAAAAMYIDTGTIDHNTVVEYINNITNPEVDKDVVFQQYPVMAETLIANAIPNRTILQSEQFIWKEILPRIGVGGTYDAFDTHKRVLKDFKTMGSLDTVRLPTKFPRAYWFQLMTYAWILTQQGTQVDYIQLDYVTRANTGRISEKTGKPLKDYPSTYHALVEPVTTENLELIGNCIKLIAESVDLYKKQPSLRHIIAQDYRLKAKPEPVLFKD